MFNIQLTVDAHDIALDQLIDISSGPLMVNLEASQTERVSQDEIKQYIIKAGHWWWSIWK